MADPGTIMIGLQAASSLMGGSAQAKADNAAADVSEANARTALDDGTAQQYAIDRRLRATQGDALVAEGAGGGTVGTGSALEALRQNAINAQFDVLSAQRGATSRANAYYADAAAKRSAAKGAMLGGLLGAGAAALKGTASTRQANGPSAASFGPSLPIPSHLSASGAGLFDMSTLNGLG